MDLVNSKLVVNTTQKLDLLTKQLYIQSKSFDDVVANYTSRNSDNKRYQIIQGNTPPFLTGIGEVT